MSTVSVQRTRFKSNKWRSIPIVANLHKERERKHDNLRAAMPDVRDDDDSQFEQRTVL
jgi:hypothetical protein